MRHHHLGMVAQLELLDQELPELLEVAVASSHRAAFVRESWQVRPAYNLVVRVHASSIAAGKVSLRVAHFYFQEVLWFVIYGGS